MIAAFLLYYIDRHYGFNYIFSKSADDLEHFRTHLKVDTKDPTSPIDSFWIFAISVVVLSFVMALKRVMDRRQDQNLARAQDLSYSHLPSLAAV